MITHEPAEAPARILRVPHLSRYEAEKLAKRYRKAALRNRGLLGRVVVVLGGCGFTAAAFMAACGVRPYRPSRKPPAAKVVLAAPPRRPRAHVSPGYLSGPRISFE